jgi:hypothetical protein
MSHWEEERYLAVLQVLRDHGHDDSRGIDTHAFRRYLPHDPNVSYILKWLVRCRIVESQRGRINNRDVRFFRLQVSYEDALDWLDQRSTVPPKAPVIASSLASLPPAPKPLATGLTPEDIAWMDKYRQRYQARRARVSIKSTLFLGME